MFIHSLRYFVPARRHKLTDAMFDSMCGDPAHEIDPSEQLLSTAWFRCLGFK